jgi:agmatinase
MSAYACNSDNAYAIKQMEEGHKELLHRQTFSPLGNDSATGEPLVPMSKVREFPAVLDSSHKPYQDGKHHPRLITLGGDHTIVLPLLRSIYSAYGEISVIHFDR